MKKNVKAVCVPILSLLLVLGAVTESFAQKAEIEKRLVEYGISSDNMFNNFGGENSNYTCNAKFTEITTEKTTKSLASYDPGKPQGSQWTLESVNGSAPSKKDKKNFDKAHNAKQDKDKIEPDDNSWEIVKDDEHFFVIGLRYNESSLPHKYKFLAQCKAEMYIDKEAKSLYKLRFYNEGELKIKIFTVVKLDMTVEFMPDIENKTYLIKDETIVYDAKLMGQIVEIKDYYEFYDYKKVK